MKKAEGEEQLPVEDWFGAVVELSFRHQLVETFHVGFHTLRAIGGSVSTTEGFTGGMYNISYYIFYTDKKVINITKLEYISLCTFGGSVVILIPACRIATGNSGCGEELSHSLKFECGLCTCSCSTSLSSSGIQDSERWQLARNTQ